MARNDGEQKRNIVKVFAIGALVSALAGYVAGILTAPKSGRETREDIKSKANETYSAAEKRLKQLHTELGDIIDKVSGQIDTFKNRKEVSDALDKGRDAKQKAREVLSVLHDGETDDKELKKAVKDATDAIEHLRNFLRK